MPYRRARTKPTRALCPNRECLSRWAQRQQPAEQFNQGRIAASQAERTPGLLKANMPDQKPFTQVAPLINGRARPDAITLLGKGSLSNDAGPAPEFVKTMIEANEERLW